MKNSTYKIYKKSLSINSSNSLFKHFVKVCSFFSPKDFEKKNFRNWDDKNLAEILVKIRKNKKLPSLSSKNIILYEHKDLYRTKIYFGSKCSGIPFSNFAYSSGKNGVEDLIEIKKLASLIMDDFGFS